jgi:hypothetical protein
MIQAGVGKGPTSVGPPTTLTPIQAAQGATLRGQPISPDTVILSAVASSRSEEVTQSKDPYPLANQNKRKREFRQNSAQQSVKYISTVLPRPMTHADLPRASQKGPRPASFERALASAMPATSLVSIQAPQDATLFDTTRTILSQML